MQCTVEELDESELLYMLPCNCVFSVSGLDGHMAVELDESLLTYKKCPNCSAPIYYAPRYQAIVKAYHKEMEALKQHMINKENQNEEKALLDAIASTLLLL